MAALITNAPTEYHPGETTNAAPAFPELSKRPDAAGLGGLNAAPGLPETLSSSVASIDPIVPQFGWDGIREWHRGYFARILVFGHHMTRPPTRAAMPQKVDRVRGA